MTKDKIIKVLKANMEKSLHELKVCRHYETGSGEYYLGKIEGLRIAMNYLEAMHDDEYWNEAIANAVAMGDRA